MLPLSMAVLTLTHVAPYIDSSRLCLLSGVPLYHSLLTHSPLEGFWIFWEYSYAGQDGEGIGWKPDSFMTGGCRAVDPDTQKALGLGVWKM